MRIICLICLFTLILPAFCEVITAGVYKNEVYDFLETVDLTPAQRQKILNIRKEETDVIAPFILDYNSKEEGLNLLYSLECKRFDSVCKQRLKQDIEQREIEKREAQRRILQKKNYYKLRYRNVLTKEQDQKIKKLIEETEHRDKVLAEREERRQKQEKIDKLKIWRKIPDVKDAIKEKAGEFKGNIKEKSPFKKKNL